MITAPERTIIPILLYHCVRHDPSARLARYTVTPETFALHMDILRDGDFRCLSVSQYVTELQTGTLETASAGRRVALVTFDDGWADFAEHAAPLMAERHIPSTLYVTTGFVTGGNTEPLAGPDEPMLSWSQIPDLVEAGVEIGAHGHTHPHMDTLLSGRAWDELTRSKAMLEDALGERVRSFAYPNGYNSPRLRRQTRLAGYESAAGVRNALSHTGDNLYRLARLTITSDVEPDTIRAWLSASGAPVASKREHPRTSGWRAYRYTKALLSNRPSGDYR